MTLKLQLTRDELDALRPADVKTVSEWADKHRIIGSYGAYPGPWRTDFIPCLRGIMDAFSLPHVRRISVLKSAQIGYTESVGNMLGFAADTAPGPGMVVFARQQDVQDIMEKRILAMIKASPRLKRKLIKSSKSKLNLLGMDIYAATGSSAASLGSKSIRYLIRDEIDKYPESLGQEGEPNALAKERLESFIGREKDLGGSTPTFRTGRICTEYDESNRQSFFSPCPHCNHFAPYKLANIKWDIDDAIKIQEQNLAKYICPNPLCGKQVTDEQKLKVMRRGLWVPEGGEVKDGVVHSDRLTAEHFGFHTSRLLSPFRKWSHIAAAFLQAKKSIQKHKVFINSWLGEGWEDREVTLNDSHADSLERRYERKRAPNSVQVMTAGIDVQKDGMWWCIRGWTYGEVSFLIDYGFVGKDDWNQLNDIMFNYSWKKEDGERVPIVRVAIDAIYRSDEVADWANSWPDRVTQTIGKRATAGGKTHMPTKDTLYPGISKYTLNTTFWKDKLYRLQIQGKWFTFRETPTDYKKQLTAEQKVKVKDEYIWELKPGHIHNHLLDTECLCLFAAQLINVWAMVPEENCTSPEDEIDDDWMGADSEFWPSD